MNSKFETLSRETIFRGKILNLHLDEVRLPNGATATREVVEHGGGVVIIAVWEGKALMVRQYRYCVGEALLELPAGKLEPGEDPAVCAARELEEETGYRPAAVKSLGFFYPTPGYLTEKLHFYAAEGLTPSATNLDPDEFLEVERLSPSDALEACRDGRITDAKTALGLLLYRELIKE
ncbi:MAG: NUDIX hydrolase [Oscillospiraceae bacterium]|jgi:ADP-ribose pyrophosphatase|nr:NUDIX hydrolase [Oscillospiraceae bacterium]